MKNIVHIQKNDLKVSIQDMADFSGTKFRSIEKLLTTHEEYFELLGLEVKEKGKYRDFKSQFLNEPQATFLITLMRNTENVAKFKISLVMQFFKMREQLCEVNRIQLQNAHNEIRQLQVKRMKSYKDGFISLGKYLKDNNIVMTKDTAFALLSKYNIVEHRDVLTSKVFLIDDSFGRQNGDSVIEFNSRSLDLIFRDYVYIEPTLF